MTEIYALSLFQGNKLSSYRNLTFEIVLQNKQNSFHAVVMPNSRDQRQRKQKKERWNRHNKLSCTSRERIINNNTKTEQKIEKYETQPLSPHPNPNKNEPPPTFPSSITWSNNTMIMISLAQTRQCNGCGSVTKILY